MTRGEQNNEREAHAQPDYAVAQDQLHRHRGMYPCRLTARRAHRDHSGAWLARRPWGNLVIATKVAIPRPRLIPRPHRPHARSDRRGRLRQYRALDRSPTSTRSIGCSGTCRCRRDRFDPAKEKDGPSIGTGRRHGGNDQDRQDPALWLVERVGRGVCEFALRERAACPGQRRSRTASLARAAWTTISPRCCSATRCRPGLQPARRRHAVRQVHGWRKPANARR